MAKIWPLNLLKRPAKFQLFRAILDPIMAKFLTRFWPYACAKYLGEILTLLGSKSVTILGEFRGKLYWFWMKFVAKYVAFLTLLSMLKSQSLSVEFGSSNLSNFGFEMSLLVAEFFTTHC